MAIQYSTTARDVLVGVQVALHALSDAELDLGELRLADPIDELTDLRLGREFGFAFDRLDAIEHLLTPLAEGGSDAA